MDAQAVREKLAALRRKSVFVRSLTIEDDRTEDKDGDDGGIFPEEISCRNCLRRLGC